MGHFEICCHSKYSRSIGASEQGHVSRSRQGHANASGQVRGQGRSRGRGMGSSCTCIVHNVEDQVDVEAVTNDDAYYVFGAKSAEASNVMKLCFNNTHRCYY